MKVYRQEANRPQTRVLLGDVAEATLGQTFAGVPEDWVVARLRRVIDGEPAYLVVTFRGLA
jgi:hypothetical protein